MKRWGLRISSLSAVTKADAGQGDSNNHLTLNVLNMYRWRFVVFIF
jgi:hypothetical protein